MIARVKNTYTTVEQSKRLLAIGMPIDSADGYSLKDLDEMYCHCVWTIQEDECYSTRTSPCYPTIPHWSAIQLIYIFVKLTGSDVHITEEIFEKGACENIIVALEKWNENGWLIFSKLEE